MMFLNLSLILNLSLSSLKIRFSIFEISKILSERPRNLFAFLIMISRNSSSCLWVFEAVLRERITSVNPSIGCIGVRSS